METERIEIKRGGRVFAFYFTPAKDPNKPILFIFHGHGYNENPSAFKSPNWNVVCPMDNYGYEGLGSWYLGENGDFFWLDAMIEILNYVRERSGKSHLYMWGSSMGGYASILYGYLLHAKAVYANTPQTILLGSKYSNNGAEKYFNSVLFDSSDKYNDLRKVLKKELNVSFFFALISLKAQIISMSKGLYL